MSDDERESIIRRELIAGNIPNFLRQLVPIQLRPQSVDAARIDVIICAAPDYLAIGSDEDYLLVPMRLGTLCCPP